MRCIYISYICTIMHRSVFSLCSDCLNYMHISCIDHIISISIYIYVYVYLITFRRDRDGAGVAD